MIARTLARLWSWWRRRQVDSLPEYRFETLVDATVPAHAVLSSVRRVWDLSGTLVTLRDDARLQCPICRRGRWTYRYWRYFKRVPAGTLPYRCDVGLKCNVCSYVATFGVVIDEDCYGRAPATARRISRSEAARIVTTDRYTSVETQR